MVHTEPYDSVWLVIILYFLTGDVRSSSRSWCQNGYKEQVGINAANTGGQTCQKGCELRAVLAVISNSELGTFISTIACYNSSFYALYGVVQLERLQCSKNIFVYSLRSL